MALDKQLEASGCHILAIKDLAGLLKPAAAGALVRALKSEISMPIRLHTHDTSGISGAAVLAAVDAGVDAFDAAMAPMSGLTSQPCLGSLVEALRHTGRDTGLDPDPIRRMSFYWEAVRENRHDLSLPDGFQRLRPAPGAWCFSVIADAGRPTSGRRWRC